MSFPVSASHRYFEASVDASAILVEIQTLLTRHPEWEAMKGAWGGLMFPAPGGHEATLAVGTESYHARERDVFTRPQPGMVVVQRRAGRVQVDIYLRGRALAAAEDLDIKMSEPEPPEAA